MHAVRGAFEFRAVLYVLYIACVVRVGRDEYK